MENKITVITPTTGKDSLFNLIESIARNTTQSIKVNHIVLWDDKREDQFLQDEHGNSRMVPEELCKMENENYSINNIIVKGRTVQGDAYGSFLRSVGLMIANTELVTFADSDVMWEENHLKNMLETIKDKNWVYCKRKIWTLLPDGKFEFLGIDEFESVGEEAKTPYKMVDNNCVMFRRRFGSSAACLYREVVGYCDDRIFYDFMKKYAGEPAKTNQPSINQVCPIRLVEFFRQNCTK